MNFILAVLSLWFMGASGMLIAFGRNLQRLSGLEFFSISFFIGLGLVTAQLFIYYCLNISYSLGHVVWFPILSFIYVVGYFIINKDITFLKVKEAVQWGMLEKFVVFIIFFQVGWILYRVLPMPVNSFDALASYAFKAKIFYLNHGIPHGFFGFSEDKVSHPDYPLLLPLVLTWVYLFTGFDDMTVVMVMPVMFVFFLALLYSHFKKFFGSIAALYGVFFIATILIISNYVVIIHADFVLMAFVTGALLYFMDYIQTFNNSSLCLASLMLGLSLWTKNEAMIYVVGYFLSFGLLIWDAKLLESKKLIKSLFLSLVLIIFIAGPWFVTKHIFHTSNCALDISKLTTQKIFQNIKDYPLVLNETQKQVFGPKKWNIFWIVLLGIVVVKYKEFFKGNTRYLTSFVFFYLIIYMLSFLLWTRFPPIYYANKDMARFMIHWSGPCLVLTMFLLKKDFTKR